MPDDLTLRQQIMQSLDGSASTARELAHLHAIPERQIEEHLRHIARTVVRLSGAHLVIAPSACGDCGYIFQKRQRLTRPGRCPRCRSEHISAPRFSIRRGSRS